MNFRIPKKHGLIYLVLVLAYIYEVSAGARNIVFLLSALLLPYIVKVKPSRHLLSLIAPLMLVVLFSIPGVFLGSSQLSDYYLVRDVFYLVQAPVIIYIGGIIFIQLRTMQPIANGFVIILTLASMFMLFGALMALIGGASYIDIRYNNPYYSSAPITLFILLFASELSGKRIISRRFIKIIMPISVAAIILSFSRLQYFTCLLTVLIFAYQLRYLGDSRSRKKSSTFLILALVGVLYISTSQIVDSEFIRKIQLSASEMFLYDRTAPVNAVERWRAYEIILVFEQFRSANPFTFLFGHGLGSGVVLPFTASENLRAGDFVPIFHNSFGTVFLKSGIFGSVAYAFFYLRIFYLVMKMSRSQRSHSTDRLFSRLVLIGILVLIFSGAFVTHGLYTNSIPYPALLLLGSALLSMRGSDTPTSLRDNPTLEKN